MSSVILTNWTVYYASDVGGGSTGYKQIRWTGSGGPETNTNTVNQLYSALADLFSVSAQNINDTTIPMRAVTPSVFEIGSFDQRDLEPWFIDPVSIRHLTGGSLETINWTRVTNADPNLGNSGIVKMAYTAGGTPPGVTDVGRTITMTTDGDTGTILYVDTANLEMWIRPTNSTTANSFDNAPTSNGGFTIAGSAATGNQNGASVTGERVWPNVFTLGTIVANSRIFVYQDFSEIANFWGDGQIDRLFLTNDGFDAGLIDSGFLTIYARQYGSLYDHFQVDVSAGGRNPVALSSVDDINNDTGYRTFTGSSGVSDFDVGNYIYVGATYATATKRGVLTAVGGTIAAPVLTYYLTGDLTDFAASDAVKEYVPSTGSDGDGTCTAGAPSAAGPNAGTAATITVTFGQNDQDLSNGNGSRPYSVLIDCQQVALPTVYERLKYLIRRGSTGDIDDGGQTVIGENYEAVGIYYIPYDAGSIDNPFTEGETITGPGGFTGTLTSKHDRGTNEGFIIMRGTRGTTPSDGDTLTGGTSLNTAVVDDNTGLDPVEAIIQAKTAPFGTFAGGTFFGARGVFLTDVPAADGNNYQLIDSEGVTQSPPATIAIAVNGIVSGDRVTVFRATGDNNTVDKTVFTSHASSNTAGNSTFVVSIADIDTDHGDTPAAGKIRVVNNSGDVSEQRYRYASWTASTFTFVTGAVGSATATESNINILTDGSGDFGGADDVEVGDVIRNTSTGESGKVTRIISTTQLRTSGLIAGWTSGNNYTHNVLDRTYDGTDTAYVPFIDQESVGTSVSVSVTYETDRFVTTRVRKLGILPFTVKGKVISTGLTVGAVRTSDIIVNLPN